MCALCSTACTPMAHEDVDTRVRVKCILDSAGYAMYFSRGVLPQNKDGQVRPYPSPFQDRPYLLHLGLACFDRGFLARYCQMPPTPLMVRSLPCHAALSLAVPNCMHWLRPQAVDTSPALG